jgi:hypothetical protein
VSFDVLVLIVWVKPKGPSGYREPLFVLWLVIVKEEIVLNQGHHYNSTRVIRVIL